MYQTVMVIDDSGLDCFLAETMIKNCKFAEVVVIYKNPNEALKYLRSLGKEINQYPDVLFLDIQMPVMNGFDFLDGYLELDIELQQHCKIVISSSSIADEDQIRIKNYPVVKSFLPKPWQEEMLVKI